jgi:uncharacterized membrane protein
LKLRRIALLAAAILYISAGIAHLWYPAPFVRFVPSFVPWPLAAVYISGIAEIAGGAGLLWPPVRRAAVWGLVALLIAVFPANIHMALNGIQVTATPLPAWILWARLPLQIVLIWWVLWLR